MALVWFGYVATREWRSGTNLLLERRANEALALVRAALSADMKGAWITAIVPFNTTNLDEDPPYSMFQVVCAHLRAVPVSRVLRALEAHRAATKGPPTRSTAPIAHRRGRRGPRRTTRSRWCWSATRPRWPELVAAVRKQATAASPFIMLERPIDGTPYQIVAHALFASSPPHALLGFMAFTVNEQWLHAQYFDPLVEQVEKIGGGAWAASRSRCPTTRAGS